MSQQVFSPYKFFPTERKVTKEVAVKDWRKTHIKFKIYILKWLQMLELTFWFFGSDGQADFGASSLVQER